MGKGIAYNNALLQDLIGLAWPQKENISSKKEANVSSEGLSITFFSPR